MKYKKYFRKTSLKQNGVGDYFLNIVKEKSPKTFLEVGVFHGVTARNVCELLYKIHKEDFKYIGLDLFEVNEAEQKSAKYTIVKSKILESSNQPEMKINWRIYTKDPMKPLIRDLIVEGLSLARTQKEEFASILSSNDNDIKILINKLNDFVNN